MFAEWRDGLQVCQNSLCMFQYEKLHLGPSLEHEIKTNAPAVDLLIQLAYGAAVERSLTVFPFVPSLFIPRGSLD